MRWAGRWTSAWCRASIKPEEEQQGAYWVSVVKDAVFPAINAKNPVLNDLLSKGVTHDQFVDIFITGKIKTWGELVGRPEIKDEIHVYTRSDSAGAADAWAKYPRQDAGRLEGHRRVRRSGHYGCGGERSAGYRL